MSRALKMRILAEVAGAPKYPREIVASIRKEFCVQREETIRKNIWEMLDAGTLTTTPDRKLARARGAGGGP